MFDRKGQPSGNTSKGPVIFQGDPEKADVQSTENVASEEENAAGNSDLKIGESGEPSKLVESVQMDNHLAHFPHDFDIISKILPFRRSKRASTGSLSLGTLGLLRVRQQRR